MRGRLGGYKGGWAFARRAHKDKAARANGVRAEFGTEMMSDGSFRYRVLTRVWRSGVSTLSSVGRNCRLDRHEQV